MKRKFLAVALVSFFITGFSTPSFAENTRAMEDAMNKNKTMGNMKMTQEMMDMAMTTAENNKNLMMMGSKMIADGNKTADAEKMLMGARMMHMGIMNMHMGMMHMRMMDKQTRDMMMSKMKMTPENMANMSKMMMDNAMMMGNMGNKMMSEGNAAGDSNKMMLGSKMVHMGMMMHAMSMAHKMGGKMDKDMMNMMPPMGTEDYEYEMNPKQ
jgi:hypothetical protein